MIARRWSVYNRRMVEDSESKMVAECLKMTRFGGCKLECDATGERFCEAVKEKAAKRDTMRKP